MKLLDNSEYLVEREVLNDALVFENGVVVVDDDRAAVVKVGDWHKCVFRDIADFYEYADKFGLYGKVCLLGAPPSAPLMLGFENNPCKTFAYIEPMPPTVGLPYGVEIKRLAPSLAQTVAENYSNHRGGYSVEEMADLMRGKGVFGAIYDGKLAGFIARHFDGGIGLLKVFEQFRRRGIGAALERFMINFVMTYGRTPFCEVYADNNPCIGLQKKLGMTAADGLTFWTEITRK